MTVDRSTHDAADLVVSAVSAIEMEPVPRSGWPTRTRDGLIRLANGVTTVEKTRPPSYFRLTSLIVRPSVPDVCHTPVFRQCLKAAGHWDTACSPRLATPLSHSAFNLEQVVVCAVAAEQIAINAALKILSESLCIAASQSQPTLEAAGVMAYLNAWRCAMWRTRMRRWLQLQPGQVAWSSPRARRGPSTRRAARPLRA